MRPSRWVRLSALLAIGVVMLAGASAASAQTLLDDSRQSLDLLPDPTLRSPRLLGMGRLTLVVDEPNNALTLWDFAQMPAGIQDADTVSVFEVRPSTAAASTLHDILGTGHERQSLAARDVIMGYEGWRRAPGATAFGVVGDFGLLRTDLPYNATSEERTHFSRPTLIPAVNGPMPFIFKEHMRYGLRGIYSFEKNKREYREFVQNSFGQYLDENGTVLQPPDEFQPLDTEVSTTGLGASARYEFGSWLRAGAGVDAVHSKISRENLGLRHGTFIDETRPMVIGQAVLRGTTGGHFEWIADGRTWTSSSEPTWRYTTSAGQGSLPLSGRGKLLERDETGNTLRSRVRIFSGAFEVGGSISTGYRKIEVTPPAINDITSFNYFRNITYLRQNADSIFLPDSVVANTQEQRSWEAGGGVSWRSPWRALLGVEYHVTHSDLEQTVLGKGPQRAVWDVRSGIELPMGETLLGRGGFIYRSDDTDELTANNEYISNSVTLGLGIRPAGRTWFIETGYAYEWLRGDYADPQQTRGVRNQFMAQVRWNL
jgi:hypothetical protein